jgi:glutathione S-transferase
MSRLASLSKLLYSSKMPAFTLYGARGSTNTDRVRLTLAEGGFTDYEFVSLNLQKGEQKVRDSRPTIQLIYQANGFIQSKDHLNRHSWGKIPCITSANGFALYESRAICKYLATKYSFPLLPPSTDLEASAHFDQAASVETLYFAGPAGTIAFEKVAKRFIGLPADETAVSNALKAVESFFDVADHLLQRRGYMAGDEFTLVDIYYIPLIQRLFACGYGDVVASREAVSAWWTRCINRPAIKAMLASDKAEAATTAK